ncbi:MAG: 5-(carboxyamino)imidazole ribonucleotide mutase [Deltaproteobacteria bacterium]|nr:5-(carboxyamino)imidazole ribonucleotide mutase [Deltaproteobacteria bacterium]MBW1928753.1 5-(carboxyamino)imidazole ribonucleotide mutase [Deltaproteobacteria bacterium]MBW2025004.1 5-(carboxyamino)imidazole ribonucleotide mutase [Deltaproteobacteria bacterium]MBW2124125.1 5-(carboxyamino)imidazole ribonucleotide mutase [Deltaproteobacteria bacterium]RLB18778.1 MAG: 5-(carboxyamino)imidazole ribonucleotide mutase [Deltaproteobacteria bacterium]
MVQNKPLVGVIMGSASDTDVMRGCMETLDSLEIPYEVKVLSAHRSPDEARAYALSAKERGIEVIIAGAGWAAHLAGALASHTIIPVIGVPIDSSPLNGLDALLSTVQMPPGVPVATVAIGAGGARNAAVLAAEILALKYPELERRLVALREKQRAKVLGQDTPS